LLGKVLIRHEGKHLLAGRIEQMARARGVTSDSRRLIASGPGKLAEALGVTRLRDNGKDLTRSDLLIVDDGFRPAEVRYVVAGSEFLSKPVRRRR
jgi:3-methyladenine DNA glycosylase Mpg